MKKIIAIMFVAIAAFAIFRLSPWYPVSSHRMVGPSMEPGIQEGAILYPIDDRDFMRGDVVLIPIPPAKPPKKTIKRIIGLPGESIELKDNVVYINGLALHEPYAIGELKINNVITLGSDEYYVLGDNRAASSDSRMWGPLKKEQIITKLRVE